MLNISNIDSIEIDKLINDNNIFLIKKYLSDKLLVNEKSLIVKSYGNIKQNLFKFNYDNILTLLLINNENYLLNINNVDISNSIIYYDTSNITINSIKSSKDINLNNLKYILFDQKEYYINNLFLDKYYNLDSNLLDEFILENNISKITDIFINNFLVYKENICSIDLGIIDNSFNYKNNENAILYFINKNNIPIKINEFYHDDKIIMVNYDINNIDYSNNLLVNNSIKYITVNYSSYFNYNIHNNYNENNNIFLIKNIISIEDCDFFRRFIDNTIDNKMNIDTEEWTNNSNVNCKFFYLNIFNKTYRNFIDDKIYKIIGEVINFIYHNYSVKCNGDSGYCFRKIFGPTRLHTDNPIENTLENNISSQKLRNMSIIICLNDDYEGGEFTFPRQNYSVKLKKGEIIAFPPYWTHPHMVNSPKNGTYRYTINTWLYQ